MGIESVVLICDRSPIGTNIAEEAIRLGSGFVALGEMIDCKVVYMADAVRLFHKNTNPEAVGMDSLDQPIEIADLSELEICLLEDSLKDAGMTADDLIDYEMMKIITYDELADIIAEADVCMRY